MANGFEITPIGIGVIGAVIQAYCRRDDVAQAPQFSLAKQEGTKNFSAHTDPGVVAAKGLESEFFQVCHLAVARCVGKDLRRLITSRTGDGVVLDDRGRVKLLLQCFEIPDFLVVGGRRNGKVFQHVKTGGGIQVVTDAELGFVQCFLGKNSGILSGKLVPDLGGVAHLHAFVPTLSPCFYFSFKRIEALRLEVQSGKADGDIPRVGVLGVAEAGTQVEGLVEALPEVHVGADGTLQP